MFKNCFFVLLFLITREQTFAWESAPARDLSHGEPIFSVWPAIKVADFNPQQRILRRIVYKGLEYFNEVAFVMPDGKVYLQLIHLSPQNFAHAISGLRANYVYLPIGQSRQDQNQGQIDFYGIKTVYFKLPQRRLMRHESLVRLEPGMRLEEDFKVFSRPNFSAIEIELRKDLGRIMTSTQLLSLYSSDSENAPLLSFFQSHKVGPLQQEIPAQSISFPYQLIPLMRPWRIDHEWYAPVGRERSRLEALLKNPAGRPKVQTVLLSFAFVRSKEDLPDPKVFRLQFADKTSVLVHGSSLQWLMSRLEFFPFPPTADRPASPVARTLWNWGITTLVRACQKH